VLQVPDNDASKCMHCKTVEFSILVRRHHCRKCGRVVCNDCSNKRFLLPEQSKKPLRVCLQCYDELSRQQSVGQNNVSSNKVDSSGEDTDDDHDDTGINVEDASKSPNFYNESQ